MSKNKGIISDHMKEEISKELGVADQVKANGWRDVSSKDCGNIVKKALELSEKQEMNNK
jgi:small acid-soluble spore protein F (minor alpha/beta-type SASP)